MEFAVLFIHEIIELDIELLMFQGNSDTSTPERIEEKRNEK